MRIRGILCLFRLILSQDLIILIIRRVKVMRLKLTQLVFILVYSLEYFPSQYSFLTNFCEITSNITHFILDSVKNPYLEGKYVINFGNFSTIYEFIRCYPAYVVSE